MPQQLPRLKTRVNEQGTLSLLCGRPLVGTIIVFERANVIEGIPCYLFWEVIEAGEHISKITFGGHEDDKKVDMIRNDDLMATISLILQHDAEGRDIGLAVPYPSQSRVSLS